MNKTDEGYGSKEPSLPTTLLAISFKHVEPLFALWALRRLNFLLLMAAIRQL